MSKKVTLSLLGTLIAVVSIFGVAMVDSPYTSGNNGNGGDKKKSAPNNLSAYLQSLRQNQVTGEVTVEDVENAQLQASKLKSYNKVSDLSWSPLGPDNLGGRTNALLFDENNDKVIFAGSATGGLWKSTTGGSGWDVVNDDFESLVVSSLAQGPNGKIYFGTGEMFTNFNVEGLNGKKTIAGFEGQGIWVSADGTSFERLASTWTASGADKEAFKVVSSISVNPDDANNIVVSTIKGIRTSKDGGTSWANPLAITTPAQDVEFVAGGAVLAAVEGGLYKSTDGGTSFTNVSGTAAGQISKESRLEIEVAKADRKFVYAVSVKTNGELKNVYQSKDGGDTWTVIGPGSTNFNPLGDQGNYSIGFAIDNNSPERLFFGGADEVLKYSTTAGWERIGSATPDFPQNPTHVGVFCHAIATHPTNSDIFFLGVDDGIYTTSNATSPSPSFGKASVGYNTGQFFSASASGYGRIIGGSFGNGTVKITGGISGKEGNVILSGNSVESKVSYLVPNGIFTTVPGSNQASAQNLLRSQNGGNTFSGFYDRNVTSNDIANSAYYSTFSLWEDFTDLTDTVIITEFTQNEEGFDTVQVDIETVVISVSDTIVEFDSTFSSDTTYTMDTTYTKDTTIDGTDTTIACDPAQMDTACKENVAADTVVVNDTVITSDTTLVMDTTTTTEQKAHLVIPTPRSKLAVGLNNTVYYTEGALDFINPTRWFDLKANLLTSGGKVTKVKFSEDGNHLFVVQGSKLFRISGLRRADVSYTTVANDGVGTGFNPEQRGITTTQIGGTTFGSQLITDIAIDPNNPDRVVVTLGNYGNTNYVYVSSNATTATPIFAAAQGALPAMPVYSGMINHNNGDEIILGTEMGIYASSDFGTTWFEANNNYPRVITYQVSQQRKKVPGGSANISKVYAASFGRGLFTSSTLVGINNNFGGRALNKTLKVYPNPAKDFAAVEVVITEAGMLNVEIYNIKGQLVKTSVRNVEANQNTVQIDVNDLSNGTYFVRLIGKGSVKTGKFAVTR
ncbi:MAG: hypothetical protein ACJATA_001115 [Sphingobacteriales bacterium]|jgi:hypothetical protein